MDKSCLFRWTLHKFKCRTSVSISLQKKQCKNSAGLLPSIWAISQSYASFGLASRILGADLLLFCLAQWRSKYLEVLGSCTQITAVTDFLKLKLCIDYLWIWCKTSGQFGSKNFIHFNCNHELTWKRFLKTCKSVYKPISHRVKLCINSKSVFTNY